MIYQDISWKRVEGFLRLSVPHILLLLLVILNVSLPLVPGDIFKPQLVAMAAYYWAVYRPTIMPVYLCFASGLVLDTLIGTPLGLNAISLILIHWLVRSQRRFLTGQTYIAILTVFALVISGVSLLQWGLMALVGDAPFGVMMLLATAGSSIIVFPLASLILWQVHRLLPAPDNRYG